MVIFSILQLIWLPEDSSPADSQASQGSDDWLIMLAEEYTVVSTMCLQMDTAPSVCLGSLVKSKNLKDMAAAVQTALTTAEALPLPDWEQVTGMAKCGGPMAFSGQHGYDDDSCEDEDEEKEEPVPVPVPVTPPPTKKRAASADAEGPSAVPAGKPKPAVRGPKAAKLAPKASAVPAAIPASVPVPTASSSLKGRLMLGAGLSKSKR